MPTTCVRKFVNFCKSPLTARSSETSSAFLGTTDLYVVPLSGTKFEGTAGISALAGGGVRYAMAGPAAQAGSWPVPA